jgi:hypothetical protein
MFLRTQETKIQYSFFCIIIYIYLVYKTDILPGTLEITEVKYIDDNHIYIATLHYYIPRINSVTSAPFSDP